MTATQQYQPLENDALVQGSGIVSTSTKDGQVVTAAQHVAVGAAGSGTVIGTASEAFDLEGGGDNALIGNEAAVVELDAPTNQRPKYGYDSVAKVRMDNGWKGMLYRFLKKTPLANSAAFRASAQSETAWESAIEVQSGAVAVSLIAAGGNPGVALAEISGDMVLWHGGRAHIPMIIDGQRWGLQLVYLPTRP